MSNIFLNLFSLKGKLGGNDLFHLSRPYSNAPDAEVGAKILPDAGWRFLRTFEVDPSDKVVVSERARKMMAPLTDGWSDSVKGEEER